MSQSKGIVPRCSLPLLQKTVHDMELEREKYKYIDEGSIAKTASVHITVEFVHSCNFEVARLDRRTLLGLLQAITVFSRAMFRVS